MTESESASRVVTIQVTEEDINKGIRGDSFRCPVAQAIQRHLKSTVAASVGIHSIGIWISEDPFRTSFLQLERPDSVKEFILSLDKYGPEKARPFSFRLDLPEWVLKAEDQEQNLG